MLASLSAMHYLDPMETVDAGSIAKSAFGPG
jgi:hypothetical protein